MPLGSKVFSVLQDKMRLARILRTNEIAIKALTKQKTANKLSEIWKKQEKQ